MFKKYKLVKQHNYKDCGVACLLMIIKYYGGNNSMERLHRLTKTDKNGTSAYNLIEAAKTIGFDANGYKYDNLNQIISLPCIAHIIMNKTYYHYVVITKIDYQKKRVYLLDPALGIINYQFDYFNNIWTKAIINLSPIRKLDNYNQTRTIFKRLKEWLKPHYKKLIIVISLSIIYTLFGIFNTYYLKSIIDNLNTSLINLQSIFVVFLIVNILKIISDYIRHLFTININKQIDESLMINTYKHVLTLPYYYFNTMHSGDIISRMNDLNYVKELISKIVTIAFADLLLLILTFIILLNINSTLFLLAIIIFVSYLTVILIFNRVIENFVISNQEKQSSSLSYLMESMNNINTIKNLNIESYVINTMKDKYMALINNNYLFERAYLKQKILKDMIVFGGITITLFISSIMCFNHLISLSNVILFNSLLIYFLEPLRSLFDLQPLIKNTVSALTRISDLYDVKSEFIDDEYNLIEGNIKYKNLSYSYDSINNVLENINLIINNQEKVMIIGQSGSGKSTLFKLLQKQYEINDNTIELNNIDINKYSVSLIKANICYVAQDEKLFNDTIYNNIALGRPLNQELLMIISQITGVNMILEKRNLTFSYLIEENGSNLSGGERQRIILARTLITKANIIIFDESMNEMDASLERSILINIFNYFVHKTIIVISHRLENKDLFNKIVELTNKTVKNVIINERSNYDNNRERRITNN